MPAILTTAIVGAGYVFVWALCRASAHAGDLAYQAHLDAARARVRAMHPTSRPSLRVVPDLRPFDWQRDAPEVGA